MGFRRRTRRRALVVGAVAGGAMANRGARQRQADEASAVSSQDQAEYAPPPADPADEIEHLAQLHDSGALTDEEFVAAKANALGS